MFTLRKLQELEMCQLITKSCFNYESSFHILEAMEEEWGLLYRIIKDFGWSSLSDEQVNVLHEWMKNVATRYEE